MFSSTESYENAQSTNQQTIPPLLLTRKEAARATRLGQTTIDRAIAAGVLKASRINRRVLISFESLLEFAQGNHIIPATPPPEHRERTHVLKQALNDFRCRGVAI